MMTSAKQYHAYARECLNLAEEAEQPDVRKSLIIEEHASPLRPIEFQKLYDVHSSGGIRSQYRNDGPDLIDVVGPEGTSPRRWSSKGQPCCRGNINRRG